MIIRKYKANTLEEAKKLIDRDLGSEAVILTVRQVKDKGIKGLLTANKLEVTAAAEREQSSVAVADVEENNLSQNDLNDNLAKLQQLLVQSHEDNTENNKPIEDKIVSETSSAYYSNTQDIIGNGGSNTTDSISISSQARSMVENNTGVYTPSEVVSKRTTGSSISRIVDARHQRVEEYEQEAPRRKGGLGRVVEARRALKEPQPEKDFSQEEVDDNIVRFLVAKGIMRDVAEDVEERLRERFGGGAYNTPQQRARKMNFVKQELARYINTTGPIALSEGGPTVVALVGSTGVGKTTSAMKIAVQYAHRYDKNVAIVNFYTDPKVPVVDIKSMLRPYRVVTSKATTTLELQQALSIYGGKDLILIDTMGQNQYYWQEIDELAEIMSDIDNAQVYLTVSAATRELDVLGAVKQFSRLPIRGMIMTKLDETLSQGTMVNVCYKTKQPLSYVTVGRDIFKDIKIADSDELARRILVYQNTPEFQKLRQLM